MSKSAPLPLELKTSLQQLPLHDVSFNLTVLGKTIKAAFDACSTLPGVILTEDNKLYGMISRRRFFEQMSRPFSPEIFFSRPTRTLSEFVRTDCLICSGETSIGAAVQQALQRSPTLLDEPVVVELAADQYRLLDTHQLLLAHSRIHELTEIELRRSHETLEQQIQDRTQQLRDTLTDLQQTQLQLIQTEKMSSLGQLVAGIAHEINNPINFVQNNLDYMQSYANDLLGLVQLYQAAYPNPIATVQSKAGEIDLAFLQEDLPKLLSSMKIGTQRICELVASLRNFSHMDQAKLKTVDIHEGIDSTLLLLKHRLEDKTKRSSIQLVKHYADLPEVECYSGQLNQVFMNILVNAIDAIEERDSQPESERRQPDQITIRTATVDSYRVQIAIADSGAGIPKQIQKQIFDPFFTTKPIGKGTGLGMSISYQIVAKHQGKLQCFSVPGEGTEFVIEIPTRQQTSEPSSAPVPAVSQMI